MNTKKSLAPNTGVRTALLLCCSALLPAAEALDNGNSSLLLHVDGNSVSADIRAEPLAEVGRVLEMKTGATMHFLTSQAKDQTITALFDNLALEAALRTILKNKSYVMVTGSAEQGVGIQIYVYPELPEDVSNRVPAADETDVAEQAQQLAPQFAGSHPTDPTEVLAPPDVVNPDPAVQVLELQGTAASYGPQSLALVLSAAQDPDAQVRSASEKLLLNDLRDVVPKETLTTIGLTSEHIDFRLQALQALAERQDEPHYARMTLESALRDTDPEVRQRAEDLLLELSESETDSMP